MSNNFSESTLDQIRERIDIVELIGQYVQLKKTGKNYSGLCPFHKEKTGSFTVEPNKQFYYCFACNKGGNVFTFLQNIEGISFPEAVKRLAKRAGIEIKEDVFVKKQANPQQAANEARLLSLLELAAKFYQHLLLEKKEYKNVLDYIQARGISRKTIETFRIGASPNGFHGFQEVALKRGYSNTELINAGLLIEKKERSEGGYDRFRERLMFPLVNKEGNVIGFGARILNEVEGQPKYLNSSESPVFSKRKNLYGLYENQRGIRLKEEVVIVEGYMDVVGLYEAGVQNAVATMGTALTEEHLREIRSYTRNIITVFDPDNAGEQAFQRSISMCMQEGFFARNLSLPDELDPDEYVRKEGAEGFYALCEKSPTQITHFLKEIAKKGTPTTQETEKILKDLTPILIASRRHSRRALLWDDIALVLKVSVDTIKALTEQEVQRQGISNSTQPNYTVRPSVGAPKKPVTDLLDQEFLFASVRWPELFLALAEEEWEKVIKDPLVLQSLKTLRTAKDATEFGKLAENIVHSQPDASFSKTIMSALFIEDSTSTNMPTFEAVLKRLSLRKKELKIKSLTAEIKLAQRSGNTPELMRLLKDLQDLRTS